MRRGKRGRRRKEKTCYLTGSGCHTLQRRWRRRQLPTCRATVRRLCGGTAVAAVAAARKAPRRGVGELWRGKKREEGRVGERRGHTLHKRGWSAAEHPAPPATTAVTAVTSSIGGKHPHYHTHPILTSHLHSPLTVILTLVEEHLDWPWHLMALLQHRIQLAARLAALIL